MKTGRWYSFALLSLFFAALMLRLILPLEYSVWGPDTGENYYIAKFFAVNGRMPLPYYGFGTTYTEFPIVYQLVASVSRITGISVAAASELSMPFLTSTLVFPIAGIAVAITERRSVGVLSALFYATSVPIIGHTSIIASDTIGEVILIFFIYFYMRSGRDRMMTAIALATAVAMVPSYHLGTVMLLLFLYCVLFYYSFWKRDNSTELLKSIVFISVITTITWAYWLTQAPNFVSVFILHNPHLAIEEAISAPYIFMFLVFILGNFFQRQPHALVAKRTEMRKEYYYTVSIIGSAAVAFIAYTGVQSVPLYPSAFTLLEIPTVVFTLFGFASFLFLLRKEKRAWPIGIMTSATAAIIAAGVLTNIPYLVPERVIEYLLLTMATFAGYGMVDALSKVGKRARTGVALSVIILLVLAAGFSTALVTSTTTPSKVGASPAGDISASVWLRTNTPPSATVASDHRLSSIVFGFSGRNATWEKGGYPIFTSSNPGELYAGLNSSQTPSGNKTIDYLLLDTYMMEGGNFYPNQTAIPVSPFVLNTIQGGNFILLYSNGLATVYAYSP